MSTLTTPRIEPRVPNNRIPPLQNGDRLTAEEYDRRYEAMPPGFNAELIKGVVYVASLVSLDDHGGPHFDVIAWMSIYRIATPGIRGADNTTLRLRLNNRPQPDACLLIDPSFGGLVQIVDRYIVGGPELTAEVSGTSESLDLGDKFDVYRENGIREYVVWRVFDEQIDWFVLRGEQYERLPLSTEGTYKSEILPGLWLDPAALIRGDMERVAQVAQQGIADPAHAAFVALLRQRVPQNRP
jgi:Uma2 family endonuclease